jgi:hypothetical protein
LAAAQIGTSGYDLSQPSSITTDRLKGYIVWHIVWLAKRDATTTNKLSVLAYETGLFHTLVISGTNEGVEIWGDWTHIERQHLKWSNGK